MMNTKIFLASVASVKTTITPHFEPYNVLESFVFLRAKTKKTKQFVEWCLSANNFLLDSGAYTFINKSKKNNKFTNEELEKYVEDYINFINHYDIKYFFEMDIDRIVGYDNVKRIRKYIEEKTGKKVIPVWHRNRGMEDFHEMCKKYKYVAIGGIAMKEIKPSEYDFLCELCNIAHSYNCKVHGLGYSPLVILNERKCPFDTIDSTTWIGHRYGDCFILDNGKLSKIKSDEHWRTLDKKSFVSWVNFSKLPDVCETAE